MSNDLEWTLKSDYEMHPAGEWRAQFVSWEKDTHEKFGIQVKLMFQTEVLDDDGKHREISTWAKPSLHPKGKVSQLLCVLIPDFDANKLTPEELKGFSRKLDDLCGERLRIQITHQLKKDSKDEYADRITGFMPYRKQAVRTGGFDDTPESGGDKAAQAQAKPEPATTVAAKNSSKAKAEEPPTDPFDGED